MHQLQTAVDYEGSYLLGEADGEIWASHARHDDSQSLSLLSSEDVGERDMYGQETAAWLREKGENYSFQDQHFDPHAYYEGFLSAIRRNRQMRAFAAAGSSRRW
jgi:hypothetical protein